MTNDHLTELGHRRELAQQELIRLSQFPARVHNMSEDARAERLTELRGELEQIQAEIEQASLAQNHRHLSQTYGVPYGQPVSEDAQLQLKLAQADLERMLDQFQLQTAGYCKKIRAAQLAVIEKAANAGQPVRRPDLVMSALSHKLASLVETTVKHGQ